MRVLFSIPKQYAALMKTAVSRKDWKQVIYSNNLGRTGDTKESPGAVWHSVCTGSVWFSIWGISLELQLSIQIFFHAPSSVKRSDVESILFIKTMSNCAVKLQCIL